MYIICMYIYIYVYNVKNTCLFLNRVSFNKNVINDHMYSFSKLNELVYRSTYIHEKFMFKDRSLENAKSSLSLYCGKRARHSNAQVQRTGQRKECMFFFVALVTFRMYIPSLP